MKFNDIQRSIYEEIRDTFKAWFGGTKIFDISGNISMDGEILSEQLDSTCPVLSIACGERVPVNSSGDLAFSIMVREGRITCTLRVAEMCEKSKIPVGEVHTIGGDQTASVADIPTPRIPKSGIRGARALPSIARVSNWKSEWDCPPVRDFFGWEFSPRLFSTGPQIRASVENGLIAIWQMPLVRYTLHTRYMPKEDVIRVWKAVMARAGVTDHRRLRVLGVFPYVPFTVTKNIHFDEESGSIKIYLRGYTKEKRLKFVRLIIARNLDTGELVKAILKEE
ncbi:MAG: hypothetical protein ACUVXI_04895 [bacterium]